MNRQQRRALKTKPSKSNWDCPNCGTHYPLIYVQSRDNMALFCHNGCDQFFDYHTNDNVTNIIYPNGLPWGSKEQ